ncbi:hypothetical protein XENOCAPTIV_019227 [Xenoophorus captivus]|uniref:Uncharacterized protein n=1 Tax=Xenoophorus captivus TaxID=1517983 RepID=A0ABV0SAS8_9TELE
MMAQQFTDAFEGDWWNVLVQKVLSLLLSHNSPESCCHQQVKRTKKVTGWQRRRFRFGAFLLWKQVFKRSLYGGKSTHLKVGRRPAGLTAGHEKPSGEDVQI